MKSLIITRFFFITLIMSFGCRNDEKNSSSKIVPLVFYGKVTGIKDGDTFKVFFEGSEKTVRLTHIDCPEKKQPFGSKAKQFASDLCFGKNVTIKTEGKTDRNKRILGEVFIGSVCANKELVRNGLAWHFKKYSTNMEYAELEIIARQQQKGLWIDKEPIAPWDWRHK